MSSHTMTDDCATALSVIAQIEKHPLSDECRALLEETRKAIRGVMQNAHEAGR